MTADVDKYELYIARFSKTNPVYGTVMLGAIGLIAASPQEAIIELEANNVEVECDMIIIVTIDIDTKEEEKIFSDFFVNQYRTIEEIRVFTDRVCNKT